jgi:iron complex outermembrane receptor protein
MPMNLKRVRTYGSSVTLDYKRKLGNIILYIKSKYLFTNSRGVLASKWNREDSFVMTYTPRNNWYVSADVLFKKWDVGMSYRFYDTRQTTEANLASQMLPSYQLVDVYAGYTIGSKRNIEVRLDIQNIFNVNYQAIRSYAMPGRVIGLQLNYYPLKK